MSGRRSLSHPLAILTGMTPHSEHRARLDLALDDARHPLDHLVAVRQLRSQLDRRAETYFRLVRSKSGNAQAPMA